MLRCLSCNGILAKSEKVCYSCGEAIPSDAQDKSKAKAGGFNKVVSVLFYLSVALSVFTLFSDHAPPLGVCLPVTLVLLFVKSSADQNKKNSN